MDNRACQHTVTANATPKERPNGGDEPPRAQHTMTEEQEDRLIDVLQHTEHERLTSWERDRLVEWGNSYEKHGAMLTLSPKQWAIIDKIYEKIYGPI